MADQVIAVIDRSATEKTYITRSEYKGKAYIHIRVYYQGPEGNYLPSKSGVAFDEESFDQLQDALHGLKFDGSYEAASPRVSTVKKALSAPRRSTARKLVNQ